MLWVISNIHFDSGLLKPFLSYYRAKGVDRFALLSRSDLGNPGADVICHRIHEEYVSGTRDNELTSWWRRQHLTAHDWYIPADLDEFFWTPGFKSFKDLYGDWEIIPAKFFDRLAADGKIRDLTDESLDAQFPLGGSIIKGLCGGCDDKVAMARGYVYTTSGHHYASGCRKAPFSMFCHHFKFGGNNFWQWMRHRESLVNYCGSKEVAPFLRHYRNHGRIHFVEERFKMITSPKIGI